MIADSQISVRDSVVITVIERESAPQSGRWTRQLLHQSPHTPQPLIPHLKIKRICSSLPARLIPGSEEMSEIRSRWSPGICRSV